MLGTAPTGTCNPTDSYSGIASCVVTVSGGNANGVGTFNYTATATDKAGNTTVVTGTYTVFYGWSGYLQPINDTAHQGATASIFKAGSTVPVTYVAVIRNSMAWASSSGWPRRPSGSCSR